MREQVAVVTGAGRGLGEAYARLLAARGAYVAVHDAGIVRYHGIGEAPDGEYETTMAINADAAWWLCRAVWPSMRAEGYGRIVLTTSDYGLRAIDGADVAAYSVSKGAQFGLMNALAGEGQSHGILVNAICPVAATRIFRRAVQPRELTPASVAPGVAMLASRDCPFTGHVLKAAGGEWSVYRITPSHRADLGAGASPEDLLAWAARSAD